MAHNWYDRSPMWPQFNHGCPEPVPADAEPYNVPYAVLGYTEAGEPVFTVHTVDGETYDVEAGNNIIVLKDTTYTITVDGTNIVLTDSYGGVQTVPVFDSATATDTQAGLMSAADKAKLDSLEKYEVATREDNGLMSTEDRIKLDSLESYDVATTDEDGLMSSNDKAKLDRLPSSVPTYNPATTSSSGLMSAEDKAKLDGIASGSQVNVIEAITVNGASVPVTNKTAEITVSGGGGGSGEDNVIEVVEVNGTALTPDTNKAVNITVPTKTSDLTNDSNFVTTTEMTAAINTAIQGAMAASY